MILLGCGEAIQWQRSAVDHDRLPCAHSFMQGSENREGLLTLARTDLQPGQVHHGFQSALDHGAVQRKVGEVALGVLPAPGAGQLLLAGVGERNLPEPVLPARAGVSRRAGRHQRPGLRLPRASGGELIPAPGFKRIRGADGQHALLSWAKIAPGSPTFPRSRITPASRSPQRLWPRGASSGTDPGPVQLDACPGAVGPPVLETVPGGSPGAVVFGQVAPGDVGASVVRGTRPSEAPPACTDRPAALSFLSGRVRTATARTGQPCRMRVEVLAPR